MSNQKEESQSTTAQPEAPTRNDFAPNSQPNNPPVPPGPNNNSLSARMKANLPYFKTIIGILKIVSVVLGLIALGLIFYGYRNATLFAESRDSVGDTTVSNCRRSNITFCGLNTYFEDPLCIKEGRKETSCVNSLLVVIPVALIGSTLGSTFFALVLLLVSHQRKTRRYFRSETYGHLLAAFVVILSGLLLIGYFVQVGQEDLCGKENLKAEATDYVINGPRSNSTKKAMQRAFIFTTTTHKSKEKETGSEDSTSTTTTSSPGGDDRNELRNNLGGESKEIEGILANLTKQCPEMQGERYYQWIFLIGGIFAIITGVVYIVIAGFSKKESSRAAVDPVMMVMGPNGPQQRPTSSQAQMQSASAPNPESDLPSQSPPGN